MTRGESRGFRASEAVRASGPPVAVGYKTASPVLDGYGQAGSGAGASASRLARSAPPGLQIVDTAGPEPALSPARGSRVRQPRR